MKRPVCAMAAVAICMLANVMPASALPAIIVHAPYATLTLELARTETERKKGLMNRKVLPRHHGMLFIFVNDAKRNFWMKHTLVPLDMVFLTASGRVSSVAENVPIVPQQAPDRAIPRRSGFGRFVIELPAKEAQRDGLLAGAHLSLPLR